MVEEKEVKHRTKLDVIIPETRNFLGIFIPARLYMAKNLTPLEKFMLVEIQSLSSKDKICFARNTHFANFLGVTESAVKKMIFKLENDEDKGYIKRELIYKPNSKQIEKRIIKLTNKFYEEFVNENIENNEKSKENSKGERSDIPCDTAVSQQGSLEYHTQGSLECHSEGHCTVQLSNTILSNTDIEEYNIRIQEEDKDPKYNLGCTSEADEALRFKDDKTILKMITKSLIEAKQDNPFINISTEDFQNTISYFLRSYEDKYSKAHPFITNFSQYEIAKRFIQTKDNIGQSITYEDYREMIDEYFRQEWKQDIKYPLCHFMSDEIRWRLYERTRNV